MNRQSHVTATRQQAMPPTKAGASTMVRGSRGRSQMGNQIAQRFLREGVIQAKLTVNQPADRFEQEADRMADAVMRMPDPGKAGGLNGPNSSAASAIQRMCSKCQDDLSRLPVRVQRMCSKCEEELHRKESFSSQPSQADIRIPTGGGKPLPESTRHFFDLRFGHDFSRVRIHTDNYADESARDINAVAYTAGSDIVFAKGHYSPDTAHGRKLLAHELTHVVQQGQSRVAPMIQRACGTAVPSTSDCVPDPTITPPSTRFLFNVNCDDFASGQEAALDAFARGLPPTSTINVVGLASFDGPVGQNERLACSRAQKGLAVIRRSAPSGVAISFVGATIGGPSTAGDTTMRAVGITVSTPTPPPAPETVRSTRVSAVSFLSCAPCNPYTDDGTRGVSPPATEPASGFRQKHSLIAAFTTPDGIHVNPATVTTAKSDTIGITGFCGRSSTAHTVSTRGPFGITTLPAGPHGEAVQLESELHSRLGATVPATLPGSPCGFLGTASLVPAIGNHFRVRLFADGTVESEFISASSFPFHYLYEDGTLKLFGGSPVSPAVDFAAWATSTGVPLRAGLAGFKALREACCTGGVYLPCPSMCVGGISVPPPPLLPGCIADATAKLLTPCPASCAPAGSACGTLSRPSNP